MMKVDERDVLSFLKDVFILESDPGSLTMRVIRERYCEKRDIHEEYTREQRRAFAAIVDVVFDKFAKAKEAARAAKLQLSNIVRAKRPYPRDLSEDDFQATKRPRKPHEVRVRLLDNKSPSAKAMKSVSNPQDSPSGSDRKDLVACGVSESELVSIIGKVKDICKKPLPDVEKTSSIDGTRLSPNKEYQDCDVSADANSPQLESPIQDTNTISITGKHPETITSAVRRLFSPEKSPEHAINSPTPKDASPENPKKNAFSSEKLSKHRVKKSKDAERFNSAFAKNTYSKSKKTEKVKSKGLSADESQIHVPEGRGNEPVSLVEVVKINSSGTSSSVIQDKCSSGGDEVVDPAPSDDEFQKKLIVSKKKNTSTKIISVGEETPAKGEKHDSVGSNEESLAKPLKGKDKKRRKKSKDGHKSPKKSKRSKSDKIKIKNTKKRKPKKPKKLDKGAGDVFSFADGEPLCELNETGPEAKEDNVTIVDNEMKESDSSEFKIKKKKKVKKFQKMTKSSENDDTETKGIKKKLQVTEYVDPELSLLKLYIREAGIRVMYAKAFKNCLTLESKKRVLTTMLVNAGIEGNPTIEKCKKLRAQRETMVEVGELDASNVRAYPHFLTTQE